MRNAAEQNHGNGKGNGGGGRGDRDDGLLDTFDPLVELALPLIAALFVGVAIGGLIRWRGLRWSWAPAIGVPLAGLTLWIGGVRPGILAAVVVVGATALGGGRTFFAREHGGAKRERELRRLGPGQWFIRSARIRSRTSDRLRGDRLAFGQSAELKLAEIPFGASRGVHGLLVGATDGGKTTDARSICQAHIRARNAVVAIDAKGDDSLERTLRDEADRAGVPFYLWTPRGPSTYNVAARGGASEVADKLLSAHEWSEPHYLSIALRFCQREVEVLRACGVEPSLETIAKFMHPERLEALAAEAGEEAIERVRMLTDDLPKRMLDELAGARSRIALLSEAEFGVWLRPSPNGTPEIDLAEVIRSGGVAYFRLEADRYTQLGPILAAALIVDLVTLSSELQGGALRGLLFVDEFAAIGADQVSRLFATARSAGLSTLLATQGLADMRAAREDGGSDTLTAQVIQNVSYVICHRISDPEAAQLLAEMAGTYETFKLTEQVEGDLWRTRDGSGSRIPTHEFSVHPNEFKSLRQGEAIVIENGRSALRVWVWKPIE